MIVTLPAFRVFEREISDDTAVAGLDPLALDKCFIREFAGLSGTNSGTVLKYLENHLEGFTESYHYSLNPYEARAAIRDLAMFVSVIRRFGIDVNQTPRLDMLLQLYGRIGQCSPSDTILTYATQNPEGRRVRTFTGDPREVLFIDSLRKGLYAVYETVAGLDELSMMDLGDSRYASLVREVTESFSRMVSAMQVVRKEVKEDWFTLVFRPFFEPKTIGGVLFRASNGAQIPLYTVDAMLWGFDDDDAVLPGYYSHNLGAMSPELRKHLGGLANRRTIRSQVLQHSMFGDNVRNSLLALRGLGKEILKFRIPHEVVAGKNFKDRPAGSQGSGGYNVAALTYINTRTSEFCSMIDSALARLQA